MKKSVTEISELIPRMKGEQSIGPRSCCLGYLQTYPGKPQKKVVNFVICFVFTMSLCWKLYDTYFIAPIYGTVPRAYNRTLCVCFLSNKPRILSGS